jgi:hypothetical protein
MAARLTWTGKWQFSLGGDVMVDRRDANSDICLILLRG